MSRPTKATVDYFPHDTNHGKSMFVIESKFGNIGYAVFFKTLELLGKSENHFIDCREIDQWEYLLARLNVDAEKAKEIYCCFAKIGSIDKELWQHKILFSDNFVSRVADAYKRRTVDLPTKQVIASINGVNVNRNRVNVNRNKVNANKNPQSKVKKRKLKEERAQAHDDLKVKIFNFEVILNKGPAHEMLSSTYAFQGEDNATFLARIKKELKSLKGKVK